MIEQIIKSAISYIVPAIIGYLISQIINSKKKNDSLKNGVMTMLQSNITNMYFYYENCHSMPDYVYKNLLNEFKAYKQLGGNDYIECLMEKTDNWEITRTDILKK